MIIRVAGASGVALCLTIVCCTGYDGPCAIPAGTYDYSYSGGGSSCNFDQTDTVSYSTAVNMMTAYSKIIGTMGDNCTTNSDFSTCTITTICDGSETAHLTFASDGTGGGEYFSTYGGGALVCGVGVAISKH